jgi:hypothetical protein
MRKFIVWLFEITAEHVNRTYYHCYGEGFHAKQLGDEKQLNPYTYGTLEHDAWNDGWETRK